MLQRSRLDVGEAGEGRGGQWGGEEKTSEYLEVSRQRKNLGVSGQKREGARTALAIPEQTPTSAHDTNLTVGHARDADLVLVCFSKPTSFLHSS